MARARRCHRTAFSGGRQGCVDARVPSLDACTTRQTRVQFAHLALVADRAEVLVDAEHDQDEFRGDARKHHADHDAGDRGQQQDESAERADRHRGKA